MTARNDITGDRLVSKTPTEDFRNNYDLIFKKKPKTPEEQQAIIELTNLNKDLYEKTVDNKKE
jgi:hypothetical protein